jgi:hypothetical protein
MRIEALRVALLAACLAAGAAGAAEPIRSRYGDLSAAPGDQGTFVISLDAVPLAQVDAGEVAFYRVTPQGTTDYVIVELWQPGLNCRHSYLVLGLRAGQKAQRSPVFGECTDLHGASHVARGVQVDLLPAARPGASKALVERYLFSGGKLTRRRSR